jgi:hypothetical protein
MPNHEKVVSMALTTKKIAAAHVTDQSNPETVQQRRADLGLRPGTGDADPADGSGPGRSIPAR